MVSYLPYRVAGVPFGLICHRDKVGRCPLILQGLRWCLRCVPLDSRSVIRISAEELDRLNLAKVGLDEKDVEVLQRWGLQELGP